MLTVIDALNEVAGLQAIVIKSKGKHFQVGADLKWLNAVRMSSPEDKPDHSPGILLA
jgi:methylglutaconyl-CoA hydratase